MIQYKTRTADKSGKSPLEYALRLTRRHKDYLINEKAYLPSMAWAHAHHWRHRLFVALAYGLLPPSILAAKLASPFVSTTPRWRIEHMIQTFLSKVRPGMAVRRA